MADWQNTFKHPIDYMLLEDASFILLESGDKIVLNQTGQSAGLWENLDKS